MTTEHKHTPTPYAIKPPEPDDERYYIYRADENGNPTRHLIALLPLQSGGVFLEPDEASIVETRLTAEFIIRAVNSHDKLVEALEGLRRAYPHDVTTSEQHEAWTKAIAALALARQDKGGDNG